MVYLFIYLLQRTQKINIIDVIIIIIIIQINGIIIDIFVNV